MSTVKKRGHGNAGRSVAQYSSEKIVASSSEPQSTSRRSSRVKEKKSAKGEQKRAIDKEDMSAHDSADDKGYDPVSPNGTDGILPEDLDLSSSDGESDIEATGIETEIQDALVEYLRASRKHRSKLKTANGQKEKEKDDGDDENDEPYVDVDIPGGIFDSDSDEREEEEEEEQEEEENENSGSSEYSSQDEDQVNEESSVPEIQDEGSDSSEDERAHRNTIGNVPLSWYKYEDHIGYDKDGTKIIKKAGNKDALDRLLARNEEGSAEWRTVYDAYNDEEIVLSKDEMKMIQRIRSGKFPHTTIDPFEPENDWFSRHTEVMPLSAAPEPKSRFVPSKWEEKRVVKLVRAMRKGWIKRDTDKEKKPEVYMLWQDDGNASEKTQAGLTYIPAPKLKLPGHEESYNPPPEYIPTEEEKNAAILEAESEGRPMPFLPQAFDALRRVPAYSSFIRERFERCLDLYLCPRARIKRLDVKDPEALVPKLPKPKDLQPFPTSLAIRFSGHQGAVRSLSTDPSGHWLLSGSEDGTVKLWEIQTGRCMRTWFVSNIMESGSRVTSVSWCPNRRLCLAAVAVGKNVLLLPLQCSNKTIKAATVGALSQALRVAPTAQNKFVTWDSSTDGDKEDSDSTVIVIKHNFVVSHVAWHGAGDYFCSVAPDGNTRSVLVHQLSRGASQNPFRKNRGRVVQALFHPSKPFFFVATQQAVRVYNLAKQSLAQKLITGGGIITSFDIHPSGDHVIVGSEDRRLAWYDLDLSPRPYRSLRYHEHAVRAASFHRSYPLFASSSDDATVHVFHGMVYADMMTNPLIVPVKILKGHTRSQNSRGVLDVVFHPNQPWCFTAGADNEIFLYVNP